MEIWFNAEDGIEESLQKRMEEAALICLDAEGLSTDRMGLSVSFVNKETIRTLNRTYRGKDQVTDVLSFPQYENLVCFPREGEIVLGDVVICRDQAKEQAQTFGHSPAREILYLFVHSLLHLLGYDHMEAEDKKIMREKEEKVMEKIGLAEPGGGAIGPGLEAEKEGSSPTPEGGAEAGTEIGPEDRELYRVADRAKSRAYAPYSGFRVGAALLSADGRVFTGVNVENGSFGAAICAERTAAVKAVSEGALHFRAIALSASSGPVTPCGICRQFLNEFSPDMAIIFGADESHLRKVSLSQLLPEAFRLKKKGSEK